MKNEEMKAHRNRVVLNAFLFWIKWGPPGNRRVLNAFLILNKKRRAGGNVYAENKLFIHFYSGKSYMSMFLSIFNGHTYPDTVKMASVVMTKTV